MEEPKSALTLVASNSLVRAESSITITNKLLLEKRNQDRAKAEYYCRLGEDAHRNTTDVELEISYYTKAIAADSSYAKAYLNRANANWPYLQDYTTAIADLTKVIAIEPNNASAYVMLARVKAIVKDFQGAIVDLTKAIEIDPLNWNAYSLGSNIRKSIKDYEGQIADLSKLIELDPKNSYLYYERAKAKEEINDFLGASSDFSVYNDLIRISRNGGRSSF